MNKTMDNIKSTVLYIVLLFSYISAITPADRAARFDSVRVHLTYTVDSIIKLSTDTTKNIEGRTLTHAALAVMILGKPEDKAESLARLLFDHQFMDTLSPLYGWVPWSYQDTFVIDKNAIEFGVQAIGPLLLMYGTQLSSPFVQYLQPHLRAALTAMTYHVVPVSYTNIYLMKMVNIMLIGKALGDTAWTNFGKRMLDTMVVYSSKAGIHEFDSPTYYATDLESLYIGYVLSNDIPTRQKLKTLLDAFWNDIAANTMTQTGTLCGAFSRDYDFLFGSGGLMYYQYIEGLRNLTLARFLDDQTVFLLAGGNSDSAYIPDQSILDANTSAERIVLSRFDTVSASDRYSYITPTFSLGCANADYGPQDKLVNLTFASSKKMASITIVPDTFDAPYGLIKTPDRSGHQKPSHLPLHPACVQDKGTLMCLLNLNPNAAPGIHSLSTNVILPLEADQIFADSLIIPKNALIDHPLTTTSVITIRQGNAAACVRFLHIDSCNGEAAALSLKIDSAGLSAKAGRFVAYHYDGAPKTLQQKSLRIALLIVAAQCSTQTQAMQLSKKVAQASIYDSLIGPKWSMQVSFRGETLAVSTDVSTRKLISRTVNGEPMPSAVFSVINQTSANLPVKKASRTAFAQRKQQFILLNSSRIPIVQAAFTLNGRAMRKHAKWYGAGVYLSSPTKPGSNY